MISYTNFGISNKRKQKSNNNFSYQIIKNITNSGNETNKIYVARDTNTNELVVIKKLKNDIYENYHNTSKSKKENTNSSTLFRPKELTIYDAVKNTEGVNELKNSIYHKNSWYLVFEYCEYGDLFDYIYHNCKPEFVIDNQDFLKSMFLQIINIVIKLQSICVFHRDLKPENIFLAKAPDDSYRYGIKVQLGDFGLVSTNPYSNECAVGSSFYMSPENINNIGNKDYYLNSKNEVWQLTIILINLMLKQNPWRLASFEDKTFQEYIVNPYEFLSTMFPNITNKFMNILLRGLDVNPKTRCSLSELKYLVECCGNRDFIKSKSSHPKPPTTDAKSLSLSDNHNLHITKIDNQNNYVYNPKQDIDFVNMYEYQRRFSDESVNSNTTNI